MQAALGVAASGMAGGPLRAAPLWRRVQGWWRDLVRRSAEDELVARSQRGAHSTRALAFCFIGAVAWLPVIAQRRGEGNVAEGLVAIISLAAVCECASFLTERAFPRVRWHLLLKVTAYAAFIGLGTWAVLIASDAVSYSRHSIIFLIYLLLIGTSGLRDDPRVPLCAGLASILSFLTVAALVPEIAAHSLPGKAAALRIDFDGTSQISRCVILLCVTAMGTASSKRGRAVRRLSTRDGLTGLVNRAVFDACLEREVARLTRTGGPLSLAMLDLDDFKRINDEHGHAAGDEVLRFVAELLRTSFRASDLVARYGGEEFVVAFVDGADDHLAARLDVLRARIADARLRVGTSGEIACLSVSGGIASWPADGPAVADVLAKADERLYRAKRAGRNRVVAGDAPLA